MRVSLTDVVGGHVLLATTFSANLGAPEVRAGKAGDGVLRWHPLREAHARGSHLPEEQGSAARLLDLVCADGAGQLPADVVARITADVQRVLADPQVRSNLSSAGVEPMSGSAADLARLIQVDRARYPEAAGRPTSRAGDSYACCFTGPSIAFHAEWPPVMNFASNPRSRRAIAVLHPTWNP